MTSYGFDDVEVEKRMLCVSLYEREYVDLYYTYSSLRIFFCGYVQQLRPKVTKTVSPLNRLDSIGNALRCTCLLR